MKTNKWNNQSTFINHDNDKQRNECIEWLTENEEIKGKNSTEKGWLHMGKIRVLEMSLSFFIETVMELIRERREGDLTYTFPISAHAFFVSSSNLVFVSRYIVNTVKNAWRYPN